MTKKPRHLAVPSIGNLIREMNADRWITIRGHMQAGKGKHKWL